MIDFKKKIESGKKVGYSEFLLIDATEYVREFVLWKEKNKYKGYFFSIPTKYMDTIEDFEDSEEIYENDELMKIIQVLEIKGLSTNKINIFKGNSPI